MQIFSISILVMLLLIYFTLFTVERRRLGLFQRILHAGQVGIDEISRVFDIQRLPVPIQLPLRIPLTHVHIAHEHLVSRQNLRQNLEEGNKVDDPQHRLLTHTFFKCINVRHEHVVIVVKARAVDDRTNDVGDGLRQVCRDIEWFAAVFGQLG